MKSKILVCGATGFIGRNISEKLAKNKDLEVYGTHFSRPPLTNSKIIPIRVDLTDSSQVESAVRDKDIIVQAAATTSGSKDIVTRPYIHVTDNAIMNSLIFRAAHDHKVSHVIFFSCAIMYQSMDRPVRESDFDANEEMHSRYFGAGWTKVYIEKLCEFYSRLGRTKYSVIRHSNIYGPHDKFDLERSHVFGATVTKVMACQDGKLVVWGPGSEKRDLLYVDDLVDLVEKILVKQQSQFELINVGSGKVVSVNDLVQKIIDCSGKHISLEHDLSKPHIPTSLCLDISRAKEVCGWAPNTSLDEGIKRTMDWYQDNIMTEFD